MVNLFVATSDNEREQIFALRHEVFVCEQGVPVELEIDEFDRVATHVFAMEMNNLVACGRVLIDGPNAKIGRIAVRKDYRHRGIATSLCKRLIEIARENRACRVYLDAQEYAARLYERIGFTTEPGTFIDAGIVHVRMVLSNDEPEEQVTDRPDLYDVLYADFDADLRMYVDYASTYKEVLLCGAGTGRTAFPIASSGIRVYALDNAPAMLKIMAKKMETLPCKDNITIIQADMRSFSMAKKDFSCCIVPFSTFNYLLTLKDQIDCLHIIRDHMCKGGELIMELLTLNTFPELIKNECKILALQRKTSDGRIEMWRRTKFDSATQIISQEREFKFIRDDELVETSSVMWHNRFSFIGEIELLLRGAGFRIVDLHGDYNDGEYKADSECVVVKTIAE